MEKEILKRTRKKIVPINIRITKNLSTWLKRQDLSPTKVFEEACKTLGFDSDKK